MSQIHALDTATSKQVFVECSNKALKTHDPTIHSKLDTLHSTSKCSGNETNQSTDH